MVRMGRWIALILLFAFFTVGFRYPYSGVENPVNLYLIDTLLLIADPAQPKLLGEYSVPTPYGLAVRDTLLYVAKGSNGYCLYNVKDPWNVDHLRTWNNVNLKDFIWAGDVMYVMGFDHVAILNVSNPEIPVVLGKTG